MSGTTKFNGNRGVALDASGPAQPSEGRAKRVFALALLVATAAVGLAEFGAGHGMIPVAWLSVGPLLASLVLSPRITAVVAGWAVLLGLGLFASQPGSPRHSRLAPERARAAGRVRRGQLGAAHRGAAAARPGPGRGPGGAKRAAARGPGHRHRGADGLAVRLGRGRGPGRRRPARGRPRRGPAALAHRGHPRKGPAGGAPGQRRDDQLPRRLRPAGPVAAGGRPGGGPVRHAGRRGRGLRDRGVRRTRPAAAGFSW